MPQTGARTGTLAVAIIGVCRGGLPLWRHIMRPLLVDWDQRFGSDAERKVVRERGWEGIA
jgi:hypothetical protein